MIGFEPPQYHRIGDTRIACFTITDIPGGQYLYTNRDVDWMQDYLSNLPDGSCYLITSCAGIPDRIAQPSLESLAKYWPYKYNHPHDGGGYLTFKDRRTYFLFYGTDESPERAWVADPLSLVFLGRIPYKSKRQRRRERRDPSHRSETITWCSSDLLRPYISTYIHGFSQYEASSNKVGSSRSNS